MSEGAHTALAPVGRTMALARTRGWRLAVSIALGVGAVGSGIGLLAISAWLISRASQEPSIAALGVAVVGVRLFALSRGLFRYGERLVGHDAAFRSLADLRVEVFERLEKIAPAGVPRFREGDLLARLAGDVDTIQDLMIRVVPSVCIAVVVGAATVLLMGIASPAAAAILAVTLLLAAVAVPVLIRRMAHRTQARQAEARGDMTMAVVDLVEGAADLVANGAAAAQLDVVAAADHRLSVIASSSARTAGVGTGLVTLLTGLAVWGAAIVGVAAVAAGDLNSPLLAVLVLTPLATFELVAPLPLAAQAMEQVRQSAARVFEVVDADQPVVDPSAPSALPHAPYHLVLRGVAASYGPSRLPAIADIDLDLPPGRRVAIVGRSGAGKSTLANVLLRFLPYEAGTIAINGVASTDLAADDVRRVVGLAEQDAHVFDTTLRENLLIARREATVVELNDALERARLRTWVDELPEGLDTSVGAHGAALSGGQRQRLALARALLADFPVLVLDEPGEHLDIETADALTADLIAATEGRTTVLITHRLVGLEAMDEILVLDQGRVVERGQHHELLAAGGRYSSLSGQTRARENRTNPSMP